MLSAELIPSFDATFRSAVQANEAEHHVVNEQEIFCLHISNMNASNLFTRHIFTHSIKRIAKKSMHPLLTLVKCNKIPHKMSEDKISKTLALK